MLSRKALITAAGVTLAAGLALAPAAQARDHVGFSLNIGGPGYAVSVGNAPYYGYYAPRHYYHRHYYRPYVAAPVYVAPPVVYSAPVVVEPAPYYYPGRVYYRY